MKTPHPTRKRDDALDPALEALLDQALASPAAPDGLADRIMAATRPELGRRRRPGVLARIGLASTWRMAAMVALVGALAWVAMAVLTERDSAGPERYAGPMVYIEPHTDFNEPGLSALEERELLAALAAADGMNLQSPWVPSPSAYVEPVRYGGEWDEDLWAYTSHDPMDLVLDTIEAEWLGTDSRQVF